MSDSKGNCTYCRQPLSTDGRCLHCEEDGHVWTLRDWRPLAILALIIVLGFSFTRLVVGHYQQKTAALSQEYSSAGDRLLAAHRPQEAVKAYESALVYSPFDRHVRLNLGDALIEIGSRNEAMAQIRDLWEDRPDDASVNLKLARLEATAKRPELALGFYRNAIEGRWPGRSDSVAASIAVRLETAEYLITLGRRQEAEYVLISTEETMPVSSDQQPRLASLFLRSGDAGRAQLIYQLILVRNQHDADALLGAARASFLQGNYDAARQYLARIHPLSAPAGLLSVELDAIEALDPFAPGATPSSRAQRTISAYQIARHRLDACDLTKVPEASREAANVQWAGLHHWAVQLEPFMNPHKLHGRDDVIESAMRFSFQSEISASSACGQPSADDEHLLQLGRQRLGAQQSPGGE